MTALRHQSLPETAKICRKNTNNGERTIHRRGKEAQVAKNKRFPLTSCWGRHLEGAWSCLKVSQRRPEQLTEGNACKQWQVDRDSCRSTCSHSMLSELSPRARYNQNNRRSLIFDLYPARSTLGTDTRMCSPLENQADTSPSLDRFRFHRTELQLQLRLLHPPYCTPLLVVASTE